jgi:integrase
LRWQDIDWNQATVEVMGKSQRAARLPLSQEVGDALLHHLTNSPGAVRSDHVFLNVAPPFGRLSDPRVFHPLPGAPLRAPVCKHPPVALMS